MDHISRRGLLVGTGATLVSAAIRAEAQAAAANAPQPCPTPPSRQPSPPPTPDQARRLNWWREARYGLFIHYGLYSLRGRQEWAVEKEAIPWREYERLAREFSPKPGFAKEWV